MRNEDRFLVKKDLVLCTLLAAFSLFLFRDIIIGGHLLMGSDFVNGYLGLKQYLYNEVYNHHSIPFWNPYIFGGMPFWAHFESTIFYPLDFLFWILPPEIAYGYTMFLHLALAGIFTYVLARSFSIGSPGCFVAATIFICNGFIMATIYDGQMFRVQAYTWLPLIIYLLNRALHSKEHYFASAAAGFFWGVQILAGAPQDAFYTYLLALFFLVCNATYRIEEPRAALKILTIASIVFVTGAGVSAIQIVPAFEFISESVRAVLDNYDLMTLGSYPPEAIVTLFMPQFFGSFIEDNFWVSNVPWSIPLYNLYVGILPLILLFFVCYRIPQNRRVTIFLIGLAIMAFFLALGSHTPLYKLAYMLPGFNRIRAPAKIIVLCVFAMGLLAGKGMDDLFRHKKASLLRRAALSVVFVISLATLDTLFYVDGSMVLKLFSPFILDEAIPTKMTEGIKIISSEFHRLTLFGILIVLSILLWLRGIFRGRFLGFLLCGLLLVDLAYVNSGAVREKDDFYRWANRTKKQLDSILGKDKSLYRVGSYRYGISPNIEMYFGYQTIGGYTPLFPYRYYQYINRYGNNSFPPLWVRFFYGTTENTKLMDLLNVKYTISHETGYISPRKTYLPRAFIVPNCKILRREEILDYLIRPDFDPSQTVLFEEDDFKLQFPQPLSQKKKPEGLAKIISYRPDQIVLETESSGSGYLFLSEMFYPGWKAYVDGQRTRILRGNYLFRVIEHPEGKHIVRLVFDPLSIKVGIAITLLTLFALAIALIQRFRRE